MILIDWEAGAVAPNYLKAVDNAKNVGRQVGQFIQSANIDPMNVHCIGHSLGAHVCPINFLIFLLSLKNIKELIRKMYSKSCGFAGKTIKIKRISGLDPAGNI